MHGMMAPDVNGAEARLAPAEAGWPPLHGVGRTDRGRSGRGARRIGLIARPRPLPPGLLMSGAVFLDAASIIGSGLAVQALSDNGPPGLPAIAFVAMLVPLIAAAWGANGHAALLGGRGAALRALGALAVGIGGLALAALTLGAEGALPIGMAAAWLPLAAVPMLTLRMTAAAGLRAMPERSRLRAVLVGDGPQAARFAATSGGRPDSSLRLLGMIDDLDGQGSGPAKGGGTDVDLARGRSGLPRLGTLETLCGMIRRGEVDQVVVTLPWHDEARIRRVEAVLGDYPVDVRLAPDLAGHRGLSEGPPVVGRMRLVRLADRPMSGFAGTIKRLEDYALAIVGLAVAAVPMALIALAVRLDSPGPILFRQRRAGFNNRDFYVLKFRTMYHAEADQEVRRQVTEGDKRVTPVGAILRRTSLDELPQLFNVLSGDMSFIGPRPHAPGTRAGGRPFEEVVARYGARHRVKPGLTGLAQVRGWRGPTETEEKLIRRVESDLEYIDTWTPWLDLAIIMRTLLAVARMRNAL